MNSELSSEMITIFALIFKLEFELHLDYSCKLLMKMNNVPNKGAFIIE
jgi:hypothetical protein